MTALLNLAAHARVGRLAVAAAALVIGIVAFGVPAVTEAAGAGQIAGASENTPVCSIIFMGFFGWLIDLMTGGALERTLC